MPCFYDPAALILPIRGNVRKGMQNLWDGRLFGDWMPWHETPEIRGKLLHAAHGHWIQAGPCRVVRSGLRDAAPELGLEVLAVIGFFGRGHDPPVSVAEALAISVGIARS